MQIQEKIDKLKASIVQTESEITKLELIINRFPDASTQEDRWKTVRTFSKMVTPLCDKYETKHSYGCCSDSPLQAWPYLETELGKIYSHEAPLYILARNEWGTGTYGRTNFDIQATGLSAELKIKIQEHIDLLATWDVKYTEDESF